ncbi:hypothetical protein ACSBR1_006783 [Camellia fascicularis]
MSKAAVDVPLKGGFSFNLCRRNEMLSKKGVQAPKFLKTGTTIVGLIFEACVSVPLADLNSTLTKYQRIAVPAAERMESSLERIQEPLNGPLLLIRIVRKIHFMAPNIYCCGAGTAADTEAVTVPSCSYRYHTGQESRVVTALILLKSHLFSHQDYVQVALVLGGVDVTGPHLHTIYPHGSTDILPFATMGSGSPAAMAFLNQNIWDGGINLVCEAICSGIFNDLGSGSKVDVCVITKGHTEYLRNHQLPNPSTYVNAKGCSFPKKTEVLLTKITAVRQMVSVTKGGDEMEE